MTTTRIKFVDREVQLNTHVLILQAIAKIAMMKHSGLDQDIDVTFDLPPHVEADAIDVWLNPTDADIRWVYNDIVYKGEFPDRMFWGDETIHSKNERVLDDREYFRLVTSPGPGSVVRFDLWDHTRTEAERAAMSNKYSNVIRIENVLDGEVVRTFQQLRCGEWVDQRDIVWLKTRRDIEARQAAAS